ncbi:MAG: hypothetical protein EB075_11870 [Bacteroidetes bacterium]|nr:hypothetical protein [Bacteroidota bacterium]
MEMPMLETCTVEFRMRGKSAELEELLLEELLLEELLLEWLLELDEEWEELEDDDAGIHSEGPTVPSMWHMDAVEGYATWPSAHSVHRPYIAM